MEYIITWLVVWFAIGMYSFYYWWTKTGEEIFDKDIIPLWLLNGLLGVIAWFACRSAYLEVKEWDQFEKDNNLK